MRASSRAKILWRPARLEKVPVDSSEGDSKDISNVRGTDLFTFEVLARAAAASSTLRALPPWRLLAAAAARPALVSSIIVSRSICAKAAIMVNIAVPVGPVVSRSETIRAGIRRLESFSQPNQHAFRDSLPHTPSLAVPSAFKPSLVIGALFGVRLRIPERALFPHTDGHAVRIP
jgi:hypothetical protein